MLHGKSKRPVSLPGDPLAGDTSKRLILDADGSVIHNPAWRYGVGVVNEEAPVRVAELGNSHWNGHDVLLAQARRDGRAAKDAYDRVFPPHDPNAPPPPAARDYPVPANAKPWAGDRKQHRLILDEAGKLVENPLYKEAFGATATNKAGVAKDLGIIGLSILALLGGAMGRVGAAGMVGVGAAKEVYDLTKGRGSRKGSR